MRQAVIVSYARTGLAKAGRGGFNHTSNMTILSHAIRAAVERSKVDPAEIEDVIAGCVAASGNVARAAGLLAGLPVTTSGMTLNRACSSGLNAIAVAAHQIVEEGADIMVGCGVDSISFQGGGGGGRDDALLDTHPAIWMPMIETADIVAERYKLSREYQDEYALQSQQRMAAAQAAGLFKDEIISVKTRMKVVDKVTKVESFVDAVVDRDECNRPETTLEGLANYACKYAQDYFALAGVSYRSELPTQLPPVPILPEVRHNVFLAYKEAVNNVVKHAQATEARVKLELEADCFILSVADNGRGVGDGSRKTLRNGLKNMRRRLQDVHGEFEIGPGPTGGTVVQMKVPVARQDPTGSPKK